MTHHADFTVAQLTTPHLIGDISPNDIIGHAQFARDAVPDDDPVTANTRRASAALLAVAAYGTVTFADSPGDELATVVKDLMADLHHLCDALGGDLGSDWLAASAFGAYEDEL